jgi:hypothetical protein
MPRHCCCCTPSRSGGAPLLALLVIGAVVVAASWTAIAHVMMIILVTACVVAGVAVIGLAAAAVMRFRALAHEPQFIAKPVVPARPLPAARRPRVLAAEGARVFDGRTARPAVALPPVEQHLHLHWHAASPPEPVEVVRPSRRLPPADR